MGGALATPDYESTQNLTPERHRLRMVEGWPPKMLRNDKNFCLEIEGRKLERSFIAVLYVLSNAATRN